MLLTQTKTKLLPIPSNTNFVEVNVWKQSGISDKNGNHESRWEIIDTTFINLALVSEICPIEVNDSNTIYYDRTKDGQVLHSKNKKEEILKTYKLFKIYKLHNDINLNTRFITFVEEKQERRKI